MVASHMFQDYVCDGEDSTFQVGQLLADFLCPGDVIGLVGDLGAGKTLFVQGLAKGLGFPSDVRVTSPTFALVNEYQGGRLPMVHVDMYRIESEAEFEHIGLEEMLEGAGISAVEWCDRFMELLPTDHLLVTIEIVSATKRKISASGGGARSIEVARKWSELLA